MQSLTWLRRSFPGFSDDTVVTRAFRDLNCIIWDLEDSPKNLEKSSILALDVEDRVALALAEAEADGRYLSTKAYISK